MTALPAAERARPPALDAAVSTLEVPGLGRPRGMFVMADGTIATDDQTGAPLKPALTKHARCEAIVYFEDMKVYTKVKVEECWANNGKAPIATRCAA